MRSYRSLRTILFTDLVGSTERAAELGDRAWRELLRRHHATVRQTLRRWGAREVNEAGDGFLAVLDSPARGIACAAAIREAVRSLGLEVRCGVHMGEVEDAANGSVGGIGVHIGARVAVSAEPGEILVSRAVRDAVEGSGFAFEDRGAFALKGIQEERRLYRVTALPEHVSSLALGRGERIVSALRARPGWVGAAAVVLVALAAVLTLRYGETPGRDAEDPAPAAIADTVPAIDHSIAVLPFDNLSADPADEYFAEGITDDVMAALSKLDDLRVISRTSVLQYRETTKPIRQIAEELGVGTVLEGTVRRAGDRVRITVQLIDARSDEHLWSEQYDRELTDIFAIQSDVATRIVEALRTNLSPADETRLASIPTKDIEAYQMYLRGRHFWNRRNEESLRKAIDLFQAAIERDPAFALAHAGLAAAYVILGDYRYMPGSEAYPAARKSARRALEIDPELADALVALGAVLEAERNWSAAEKEYRRAIASNPNHATAHHWYTLLLESMGRMDEALGQGRLAVDLDPLSPPIGTMLGGLLLHARNYPAAIDQLEKTKEISPPDYPWVLTDLGLAYSLVGRHSDAITMHRKALALVPNDPVALADFAAVLARAGQTGEAREILDRLTAMAGGTSDQGPLRGSGPAFAVARVHAALGDTEQVLRWLMRADRNSESMTHLRYDPLFDPLRSDPRFQSLLGEAAAS